MTRDEMIAEIDLVCAIITESDKAYDELARVVGRDPESALWGVMYKAQSALVAQTSKLIGDEGEWLSWFIWENECGRKGLQAGYDKKMTRIKTAAQLARLIGAKK